MTTEVDMLREKIRAYQDACNRRIVARARRPCRAGQGVESRAHTSPRANAPDMQDMGRPPERLPPDSKSATPRLKISPMQFYRSTMRGCGVFFGFSEWIYLVERSSPGIVIF